MHPSLRMTDPTTYQLIYATTLQIPKGRVATYGQIAELSGLPRQARLVGYALNNLPKGTRIPWHRVVNAQGKISLRSDSGGDTEQVRRLQREGIRFSDAGVIDLKVYRWSP